MAEPSPPFELATGERVVLYKPAASVRGLGLTSGRLWLTDRRMFFQPIVLWLFWLAPLVGLIMWMIAKPHRREIALSDLERYARVKFGRNPNMLRLGARDGADHNFVIDEYEPFTMALTQQPAFTAKLITA